MNIVYLDDKLSKKQALYKSRAALLVYSAAWCAPCVVLKKKLPFLYEKYPHITFIIKDINASPLEDDDDISAVPAAALFVDGELSKTYRTALGDFDQIDRDLSALIV